MSHTPGPWEAHHHLEEGGVQIYRLDEDGNSSGHSIARVFESGHDGPANSHLIAAAPELLEATDGLLWLANNRHNSDTDQWWQFFEAATEDARRAHDKAKGESERAPSRSRGRKSLGAVRGATAAVAAELPEKRSMTEHRTARA